VISSLQVLYPKAILTTVDITNDTAVQNWTTTHLVAVKDTTTTTTTNNNGVGGMMTELLVIDVVIVVAAATATTSGGRWYAKNNLPIWETSPKEFDTYIDNDIRGMANVIRHFVPRLINCSSSSSSNDRGIRRSDGGTFVAVVPSTTGLVDVVSPHHHAAANNNTIITSAAYAIEGLIKSVANSIPHPSCAVILSPPGLLLPYNMDMDDEEEQLQQHQTAKGDLGGEGGDRGRDVGQWANLAGPMILKMSRRNNGMSMSVPGF
jgi:hypothetical protein